jgi:hypothetical protein
VETPGGRHRGSVFILLLVLLAPSAYFAWVHRDVPDFGGLHDDAIYFLSAKSLAAGEGYRIPSLPENPYQTKYPPLYPALLALVWKLDPMFPHNLILASALNWLLMALCLLAIWSFWRGRGIPKWHAWSVAMLFGLNSNVLNYGSITCSDVFFALLVLLVFLASRRDGWKWALAAGAMAGCAYLTRVAGIVLLFSTPVWYLWRGKKLQAALFAAVMAPFIAGWTLWARWHMYPASGFDVAYYVDYTRFERLNFSWDTVLPVLWANLNEVLFSFGSTVVPPIWILAQLVGVLMIAGVVHMARKGVAVDYALFSAATIATLLFWHFTAAERFVLPLFPLLIAGFLDRLEAFAQVLSKTFRHEDPSQRVAAYAMSGIGVLLIASGIGFQVYMSMFLLPRAMDARRENLREARLVFDWIDAHLPPGAKILSTAMDDPAIYLYTGRTGNCLPFLARWWYADDPQPALTGYREIASYSRSRGFEYVYFRPGDYRLAWAGTVFAAGLKQALEDNRDLVPLFSSGWATLYRVAP